MHSGGTKDELREIAGNPPDNTQLSLKILNGGWGVETGLLLWPAKPSVAQE